MKGITLVCAVAFLAGCSLFRGGGAAGPGLSSEMLSPEAEMSMPPASAGMYELYSWKADNKWYHAMFKFTDSSRTFSDITAGSDTMEGEQALTEKIKALPKGSQVYWNFRNIKGFSLPPEKEIERVYKEARSARISLDIIRR